MVSFKKAFALAIGLSLLLPVCGIADVIKAGTYTGMAQGLHGPIDATVTVDAQGKILSVKVDASAETVGIGADAAKQIAEQILKNQTINVDAISGATTTCDAVKDAVSKALIAAGVNVAAMGVAKNSVGSSEELTVDVVIVGAGTSGTGAALAATEAGAKVMVLEKLGKVGGLATTGMGLLATNSSLQKAAGQRVTTEQIFKHLATYNHYRMNGALTRAILDKSGSTIDWLQSKGIGLRLGLGIDQKAHLDYPKTYHMWTNSAKDFPAVYDMMQKKYGLQLKLNTRGMTLLSDEAGKILGVVAAKADGGKLTVRAKEVILCTGGFGGDEEMIKASVGIDAYNYFGLGNQGDGVKMAWAVGADKFGDHAMQIHLRSRRLEVHRRRHG